MQGLGVLEVSDGPEEPPSDGSRRQAVTATVCLHRKRGPPSALPSSDGGRAACSSPHSCPNVSGPSLPPQDSRLLPWVCFWKSCSCRSRFRLKALLPGTRFGLILLKMPRLGSGGCLQHRDCVRLECWPQLPQALGRSGVADGHCTERPASPWTRPSPLGHRPAARWGASVLFRDTIPGPQTWGKWREGHSCCPTPAALPAAPATPGPWTGCTETAGGTAERFHLAATIPTGRVGGLPGGVLGQRPGAMTQRHPRHVCCAPSGDKRAEPVAWASSNLRRPLMPEATSQHAGELKA